MIPSQDFAAKKIFTGSLPKPRLWLGLQHCASLHSTCFITLVCIFTLSRVPSRMSMSSLTVNNYWFEKEYRESTGCGYLTETELIHFKRGDAIVADQRISQH